MIQVKGDIEMLRSLIEEKSPGGIPLFLVIRGSHAYGTNIETSDIDYAGVFVQTENDILSGKYIEQINDSTNDIVIYEIRRFLELCANNNPNIIELLNTPEDCIVYKHPIFDQVLSIKDSFITKQIANTFVGYAKTQIGKAKGQDKKQNWEKDRVTRKFPIDFCYMHVGGGSIPLSKYLDDNNMIQGFVGLTKVPNSRELYSFYYDYVGADMITSTGIRKSISNFIQMIPGYKVKLMGFKGICSSESNDVKLSSIPKDIPSHYHIGYMSYNKDGYSQHCKDYREYQEWIEKRNLQRWVDVKGHGQKIDGKNMMHCYRLIDMSLEILTGKGVNVRRDNREYLLSIRKGELDLLTLINSVEEVIKKILELCKDSKLPERVDKNLINSLVLKIRKNLYGK